MKKGYYIIVFLYVSALLYLQWQYFSGSGAPIYLWLSVFLELFAIIAFAGFCNCLRQFRSVKQIHKNGIQTKAVIKDYTVRYEKIKTYYPVIQFQTAAGITCKYESTSGMSFISPKYRKGKTIPIAYIESNPGQFIIIPADYYVSAMGLVMFAFIWIPCAIGAVFLLLNNTA